MTAKEALVLSQTVILSQAIEDGQEVIEDAALDGLTEAQIFIPETLTVEQVQKFDIFFQDFLGFRYGSTEVIEAGRVRNVFWNEQPVFKSPGVFVKEKDNCEIFRDGLTKEEWNDVNC